MFGGKDARATRVIIVGGGAAGAAAAYALARAGIEAEVLERERALGGVATTTTLDAWSTTINDGVQGGAMSYANARALMRSCGVDEGSRVEVRVSFGKGATAWRNHGARASVLEELREDIERFGKTLKKIKRFEALYAFVSVERALRWHGHSKRFRDYMVYATTALFFGTGNCTRDVCSVVLARVFTDDRLRLYDYDPVRFMREAPEMFAFPRFDEMYGAIGDEIVRRGGKVTLGARVHKVERTKKCVKVSFENATGETETRVCDRVIFACNSEQAKAMLDAGTGTSAMERHIFKNITWFDDVSVTHTDEEYMKKHYEVAEGEKRDMYFIKSYEDDPSLCEMSFDLTAYQPFARGPDGARVYQSIFLNAARDESRWTKNEIAPGKIALVKWWRQFGHTVRHFTRAVPFWRFVQNKKRTLYAGSYTMVNTHEIAVISGLVAAYRCGAPYPFADDAQASFQFDLYASIIHGIRRKR
ncbi:hypothetical protein BE221DRAFT_193379 [Ostreococcus tauri]|uniref:Amine oxidase domain-containing protein n=1 Tax=Ostreococcus tauri TaxID=70448 RepID=A0A1Y5I927_OSTTA|nr:hypothetical protein BE221DRAFT_193379 [Ostreococcus tauri]